MSVQRPTRPPRPTAAPRAEPRPDPVRTNTAATTPARRPIEDGFDAPLSARRSSAPPRAVAPQAVADRQAEGARPLRVVVTGYGDFAGVYNAAEGRPNPSGELARQLADMGLSNATIEFRHLEVTHGAVEAFMAEMAENPPDVIISMGVSSRAQVEEQPQNWKGSAVDGHGQRITPGPISDGRPARERISTDLPVDAIEAALRQAATDGTLPSRTVGTDDKAKTGPEEDYFPDASAYLCNYLNYRLTETFGDDSDVTAGFVHVTGETSAREMQVVVQAVVDRVRDQQSDGPGVS